MKGSESRYPQTDKESLLSLNISGRLLLTSKQAKFRRGGDPPLSSKSLCSTAPAPGTELLKALDAAPTNLLLATLFEWRQENQTKWFKRAT